MTKPQMKNMIKFHTDYKYARECTIIEIQDFKMDHVKHSNEWNTMRNKKWILGVLSSENSKPANHIWKHT